MRRCIELAREALDDGDEPFGSLLVDANGKIQFEDRNRVKHGDHTRHPEFEIARWAAEHLTPAERAEATVYTSGEHCPCVRPHTPGSGSAILSMRQVLSNWFLWHTEWGMPAGPVAALPVATVAPGIATRGPAAEFTGEVRALHARLSGKDV